MTLALGIRANTAIFSVAYTVLLHPLPFPEPNRLVILEERDLDGDPISIAYPNPNYVDWRERAR
jgi:putative ABC transport system permease protein